MEFESRNPFTGELIRTYERHTSHAIEQALAESVSAFDDWKRTALSQRCDFVVSLSGILRSRVHDLALLITREMGKPITESRREIEKCASLCDFYSEYADSFLKDESIATDMAQSYVSYRPLGSILGIMPWNFPFWQVFRFTIPTVLAGNTCFLKHAPNVPACANAIAQLFEEAGFARGVFQNLRISTDDIAAMITDDRIAGVSLTGSTRAGKSVARIAGSALKKVVLELGGNDAYLILRDADLDLAIDECVASRLLNSGQSCIAAKRFIVDSSIARDFSDGIIARMQSAVVGDPEDEATTVGPLARIDLRDNLNRQVSESVALGANIAFEGTRIPDLGAFYPPTVLSEVGLGMPAYHEELFGPVASIIVAQDEAHAISIANDSLFGLGSAVFTQDVRRGERIARDELNSGSSFVNAFVKSDPRLPFGGIRESGMGRELSSWGIREFTNAKTIVVA